MALDYNFFFDKLTSHSPYDYQKRCAAILLGRSLAIESGLSSAVKQCEASGTRLSDSGENVLLSAPTGAGKTLAVVVPFVYSRAVGKPFADRLLYALPLRSIAHSLYENTQEQLARCGLAGICPVRLQTGETSGVAGLGDPTLAEGRIIFCTIDQLLSSYLAIPFSLSPRQANVNAGALVGSLIVLDEFHLLDPQRSLKTALLLARHFADLTQCVWMTATQAEEARARLVEPDLLSAVQCELTPEEVQRIPSQTGQKRTWSWRALALRAREIWDEHKSLPNGRKRTLVVVNTVERAQTLFQDLRKLVPSDVKVDLLHSRFLANDRTRKEIDIKSRFAEGSTHEAILVATQVVEAGLNISATVLHTELAPANALVQRAGRCARFAEESGSVFVYDTIEESGGRSYRPYAAVDETATSVSSDGIQTLSRAMDLTANELQKRSGHSLSFFEELTLVNTVHTDLDLQALDSFAEIEWRRKAADAMTPARDFSNYSVASELIRDIDRVSVLIADELRLDDPNARLDPRYSPETIQTPRMELVGRLRSASTLSLPQGDWTIKVPVYSETERGSEFRGYETAVRKGDGFKDWLVATYRGTPLALNPAIVRYSRTLGLELGVPSSAGDWQSSGTLDNRQVGARPAPDYHYQVETFQEHTAWVRLHAELLCGDESAREKLTAHWARLGESQEEFELTDHSVGLIRLDERGHWPRGTVRDLARLAALLHDLGKLTRSWQDAVWRWQELKASRRAYFPAGPEGDQRYIRAQQLIDLRHGSEPVLLAHTDFDRNLRWPDGRCEWEIERQYSRPPHALQSAWLGLPLVAKLIDKPTLPVEQLAKAVLSAIATHHSPSAGLRGVDRATPLPSLTLAPGAMDAVRVGLKDKTISELEQEEPTHADWDAFLRTCIHLNLRSRSFEAQAIDDWTLWPLAMLIARIVRLADQRGTKIGAIQAREQ